MVETVIEKTQQQEIDRAGRRLLKAALEPLGWVLTGIEEDYGIDYDVQVFIKDNPEGIWFKIQLKSSAASDYSADHTFISQQLSIDHARHYVRDLRDPLLLIHADTTRETVFWCAPQLDNDFAARLEARSAVTVRVPTRNLLPDTADALLQAIEKAYIVLANRTLADSSIERFVDSLQHQPGEEKLRQEFQLRNDTLRLRHVAELFRREQYTEALARAKVVVSDPDSAIENRFWAETQIGAIEWADGVRKGRPQSELPKIKLKNADSLRALTKEGPPHLKFFAIIAKKAAELDALAIENWGLTILLIQHSQPIGNPVMALSAYAAQAASTRRVLAKYSQCLRLAEYAAHFPGRWMLPKALLRIVESASPFIVRVESKALHGANHYLSSTALQVCKLMARIAEESGDQEAIALAISAAMMTVRSPDTEAFKWCTIELDRIGDAEAKQQAVWLMERHFKRWKGEPVEGDYNPDPIQQIVENAAASLGIDPADEKNPIMQGLRIAARDDKPTRVLKTCEHIVASRGAAGPIARQIEMLFGLQTAGSKVLHCAVHNYHLEGRDLDSAFAEFKAQHCDSCPDRKPRPENWRYTEGFRRQHEAANRQIVEDFNATGAGFRFTQSD